MKSTYITTFILVLLFLCFNPYLGICQVVKGQSEVSVGAGVLSVYELSTEFTTGDNNNYSRSPVFSFSYRYYLFKAISLGVNFAYQRFVNYDVSSFTLIAPELTVRYYKGVVGTKKNELRLYGLVSAGIAIRYEKDTYYSNEYTTLPGLQLTPIGVRFGRTVAGYCELGLGSKGLVNMGLSYHFPKRG